MSSVIGVTGATVAIEILAEKAFAEHRPTGGAFWIEISDEERRGWIRATMFIINESKESVAFAEVERVMGPPPNNLRDELTRAINRYSAESGSNTPDFILAEYLVDCLSAFDVATKKRDKWRQNSRQDTGAPR